MQSTVCPDRWRGGGDKDTRERLQAGAPGRAPPQSSPPPEGIQCEMIAQWSIM